MIRIKDIITVIDTATRTAGKIPHALLCSPKNYEIITAKLKKECETSKRKYGIQVFSINNVPIYSHYLLNDTQVLAVDEKLFNQVMKLNIEELPSMLRNFFNKNIN